VLDCVARALEHIHERGILHLDLKPENILYTADGQPKIADFGLSVANSSAQELLEGRGYHGTVDYCAPEQRAGLALDVRCDVFSLATLAYELLTGRLPGRVYVPASQRNPRLPAALDDVLRRGLARNPEERYPSVTQFRHALAAASRRTRRRVWPRLLGAAAALAALAAALLAVSGRRSPDGTTTPPTPGLPTRLWILYDKPDDLSLFTGEGGADLASGSGATVERVLVEDPPQGVPPELPLPAWPRPRPVLIVRSPGVWGFVHPLTDPTLGRRAVRHWPALLRTVVPPEKNFVRAGGFDGDCLATDHRGKLWRAGSAKDWKATQQIALDRPPDRPDDPALLLTNLDPAPGPTPLGCYQPLTRAPDPGAIVVLRYRARARHGQGGLAVYANMPAVIPDDQTGPAADRVRRLALPLKPQPADPLPNRWLYRCPAWVTPADDWQTYVVVAESPPFPTLILHRNLVIDLAGTGQVWVDDVELFVWQPGGEP
jgi:hypothetical protein